MDHYTSHPPNSSAVGYAPHATSITTLTFGGALDAKLKAIAAAGFIGVNVFEDDIRRFSGSRDEVRELCQQLGLRIIAYPFEGSSIPERRIRSQCGKMQELGCGIMVIPGDAVVRILEVGSQWELSDFPANIDRIRRPRCCGENCVRVWSQDCT